MSRNDCASLGTGLLKEGMRNFLRLASTSTDWHQKMNQTAHLKHFRFKETEWHPKGHLILRCFTPPTSESSLETGKAGKRESWCQVRCMPLCDFNFDFCLIILKIPQKVQHTGENKAAWANIDKARWHAVWLLSLMLVLGKLGISQWSMKRRWHDWYQTTQQHRMSHLRTLFLMSLQIWLIK